MGNYKRNRDWVQDYFFLFNSKPLPDELLSSWLSRVAFEHNRKLSIFLTLFVRGEGSAISRTDIDFLHDEKLLEQLANKSTLSKKEIYKMSLRSEEGYLFTLNENSLYPSFQIRKLTDKRTHHGLMFCPKCLKEDEIPYFRKKWRYNFYNVCPKHKIFLTDRCWRCYEKVNFSKSKHLKELCICYKCEKDFRKNISIKIQSNSQYGLKAIKWFERGLTKGYFIIDNQKISSISLFDSMVQLRFLLDKKEKLILEDFPMIKEYKDICKSLGKYNSKKTLSIKKEFILTAMIYFLFQKFPKNFIEFSKANNLTYRNFTHSFKNCPFWYKNMISEIIPIQNKIGREITKNEVLGAIKYLKLKGKIVNQKNVAEIVGCHFTIHRGFVEIYKKFKNENI